MEAYIGLGILALFVVGCIIAVLHGKKRKKALKQLADTLHFSFDGAFTDEDDSLLKSLNQLALFRQTRSQGAWNVMHGQANGVTVAIMDHRFSSGSEGKNTSEQTVIVFQSDGLRLPNFTLWPEGLGHKLSTSLLGCRDVNFNTHPTFSKRYHLHGHDEEAIRRTFNKNALAYLEQSGRFAVDGSGDKLMFCTLKKTVAVKDIASFLEQGFEVFGLFKGEPLTG